MKVDGVGEIVGKRGRCEKLFSGACLVMEWWKRWRVDIFLFAPVSEGIALWLHRKSGTWLLLLEKLSICCALSALETDGKDVKLSN